MIKFEALEKLEKNIDEKKAADLLRYGNYMVDIQREENNSRHRILSCDDKLYYHEMKDGEVVSCFEVVEEWKPFQNVVIWSYTPDNIHRVWIDNRHIWTHEAKSAEYNKLFFGFCFEYKKHTIFLVDDNTIEVDGNMIKVTPDSEYTYKFLKKSILASGGAKQLFQFMEHIAFAWNNEQYEKECFVGSLDKLIELYGNK